MPETKSPPLFYHPDLAQFGDAGRAVIDGPEAIHIRRARRLRPGDGLGLTDGNGGLAHCRLVSFAERPLRLELEVERMESAPPPAVNLTLASALPKGEGLAVMLDMATQLGMSRFIPLHCERSVVRFQPRMQARWRRIIEGAGKQSRRCYFPEIGEAAELKNLLAGADTGAGGVSVLAGERDGLSLSQIRRGIITPAREFLLLVGPEGGFTPAEDALLTQHGVAKISLGAQVLRIETAAIALLAAANHLTPREQE